MTEGVDNFAHIGGLIMGMLSGGLMLPPIVVKRSRITIVCFFVCFCSTSKGRVICGILILPVFAVLLYLLYAEVPVAEECSFCEYFGCLRQVFGDLCGPE